MAKSILSFVLFTFFCAFLLPSASAQEYTVNPGDVLSISVWGQQSLSSSVTVGPSGYISLPRPIGALKVAELTTTEIATLLEERLKAYIRNPIVFVSVKPAEGFIVHILGEVRTPNFYTVPEGTSLQELITRAGGLTELADIKRVRLIRKELLVDQQEQIQRQIIDYSQFLDKADMAANPTLKAQDVVLIPRLSREERAAQTVSVLGAVQIPGVHPLDVPLSLIEIIALAKGATEDSDLSKVSILTSEGGRYVWNHVSFKDFLEGLDPNANPMVSPGDIVYVPRIELEKKRTFMVNVVGQVKDSGVFPVTEGARLFDAIYLAGGFVDEASIERVTLIHSKSQNPKQTGQALSAKAEVNLKDYLMTGSMEGNPILTEGDTILVPMEEGVKRVPSIQTPFFKSIRLSIMGQVARPDDYQVSVDANLLDILKLAGGPSGDADLKRVMIIREQPKGEQRLEVDLEKVFEEGELKLLPELLANDTIFVPKVKPKRNIWGTIVRFAADVSTIAIAYFLITGKRTW